MEVGVDQQHEPVKLIRATFAVPETTWKRMEDVARAQHRSRSAIMRRHAEELVRDLEQQAAA